MNGYEQDRVCTTCWHTMSSPEDVPQGDDVTWTSGKHIDFSGEVAAFNGWLCDMHIHDMEWVEGPHFAHWPTAQLVLVEDNGR